MAREPMGQAEFRFPHEGEDTGDSPKSLEIEIEGNPTSQDPFDKGESEPEAKEKPESKDDIEIEVVDDTPKADRGRTASPPPDEVTDDELNEYSEKVQKRIRHFSKGYHDERRAKEEAQREREEAVAYAQRLREENENLKKFGERSQETMLSHAETSLSKDLANAERAYTEAYEAGNPDDLLKAQKELNRVQYQQDRLNQIKSQRPLQENTPTVQEREQEQPQTNHRAAEWRRQNTWFGADDEMTAFALGYHQKLVKSGVDTNSDEYYEKINSRMRQMFSDYFDDGSENISGGETQRTTRSDNVVAPATRTRGPRKVTLTESQIRLAKRMGVPLQEYAKQVALQEKAERNG